MSTEFVAAPILIHDRIAANRGRTLLLEVVFALAILPTFLHATSYLTLVFGMATMGMEDPVLGARGLAEPRLAILGLAALALVVTTTYLVRDSWIPTRGRSRSSRGSSRTCASDPGSPDPDSP
jgi:hypothetical protein